MAGSPDNDTFDEIMRGLCDTMRIETFALPDSLRIRNTETHRFEFNYAPKVQRLGDVVAPATGVHWEVL